jgi:hypothetical protein
VVRLKALKRSFFLVSSEILDTSTQPRQYTGIYGMHGKAPDQGIGSKYTGAVGKLGDEDEKMGDRP